MTRLKHRMLQHSRVQSFCAIVGLVIAGLAFSSISAPDLVASIRGFIPNLTTETVGGNGLHSDDLHGPEQPVEFIDIAGLTITKNMISKKEYVRSLQDRGVNSNLPDIDLEIDTPIDRVSWQDAFGYCQWLGGKMELDMRLPTYAEWGESGELMVVNTNEDTWYEWLSDDVCEKNHPNCADRMAVEIPGNAISGKAEIWDVKSKQQRFGFRCAHTGSQNR